MLSNEKNIKKIRYSNVIRKKQPIVQITKSKFFIGRFSQFLCNILSNIIGSAIVITLISV